MTDDVRKALEAAGWQYGDYAEFLGLTDEEKAWVDARFVLDRQIAEKRDRAKVMMERMFAKRTTP